MPREDKEGVSSSKELMEMNHELERLLDRTNTPTEDSITDFIGKQVSKVWINLKQNIEDRYDFEPETVYYGKKYGWTIRYRKSGKTLCSLFPERGAITVLIVLGSKEIEKVANLQDEISPRIGKIMSEAEKLHDGKWLWIRIITIDDVKDIMKILALKRKPRKLDE